MKTYRIIATTCALVLFWGTTLAQQTINKSFNGIKKISINTSSGDCIVKKGTGQGVEVTLEHSYGENYEPIIEQNGDRLTIKEKHRSGSWSGNAKWTLTVPDGIDLKFNTGSGGFEASDLDLELDMNTGSGDLSLKRMKGDFVVNTGSGDIDIDSFDGEVRANTGSGDVSASGLQGDMKFNCGSGKIKLSDSRGALYANVGSGDIEGDNIILTGESGFNSGSGDVEIELGESPEFDISVNSGSGDAILDFNGNKIAGEIVMKANKNNGEISAPFDFDKEEEIDEGHTTVMKKTANIGSSNVKIRVSTGSGEAVIKK